MGVGVGSDLTDRVRRVSGSVSKMVYRMGHDDDDIIMWDDVVHVFMLIRASPGRTTLPLRRVARRGVDVVDFSHQSDSNYLSFPVMNR